MFDRIVISTAILLFGLAAGSGASGAEKKDHNQPSDARKHSLQQIKPEEVPAAPKSSLDKLVEGVAVIAYEKLTFKGKPAYAADITGTEKGTVIEYVVSESGSFLRKHVQSVDGSPIAKPKKGDAKPAKPASTSAGKSETKPAQDAK